MKTKSLVARVALFSVSLAFLAACESPPPPTLVTQTTTTTSQTSAWMQGDRVISPATTVVYPSRIHTDTYYGH